MTEKDKSPPVVDLSLVRNALDAAAPPASAEPPSSAAEAMGVGVDDMADGGGGGGYGSPANGLPMECPVTALGVDGHVHYYLDAMRQLKGIKDEKHSRLMVLGLFGKRVELLYQFWPRKNKDGDTTGWRADLAQEALMSAAARAGVWSPFDKVRGAGAWKADDGGLVFHCGDTLWVSGAKDAAGGGYLAGTWPKPGFCGRHVYPAAKPGPRPDPEPAGDDGAAARKLLAVLATWNWKRGEVDAMLLLGWIGAAILGGALGWRPVAWITGGPGTGKSTLDELLNNTFGEATVAVADATGAGIWQKLGYATLPVIFDELEAETDGRQARKVIKLARAAASGAVILRGGQDHNSNEFMARSCFLFSSIVVPGLNGADRSRIAVLELQPLKSLAPPDVSLARMAPIGAHLRRRLADQWWHFPAVLEGYRSALAAEGFNSRGADQFGTLLAVADVLLHDPAEFSTDYAKDLAMTVAAAGQDAFGDDAVDEELCLGHLLSAVIDPYRAGARETVEDWVIKAAGLSDRTMAEDGQKAIKTFGLKVEFVAGGAYLAVANRHGGLRSIFDKTHWRGGANEGNPWVQALRRLPGAEISPGVWFAGGTQRATMIPLELCVPPRLRGKLQRQADRMDATGGGGASGVGGKKPAGDGFDLEDG